MRRMHAWMDARSASRAAESRSRGVREGGDVDGAWHGSASVLTHSLARPGEVSAPRPALPVTED